VWSILLFACTADPPVAVPTPPEENPGPGNVLLVVLDDVGVDKVAAYGLNPLAPPTPTLDALAAEGIRFTEAWAQPVCSPSRASILTGRHPRRYGIGNAILLEEESTALPEAEVTIPEMLRSAPDHWSSSLVGKWHLAGDRGPDPLHQPGLQGFDWYAGSPGNLGEGIDGDGSSGFDAWDKNTNGVVARSERYATSDTADDAVARLGAMPEPWFLYLAFNAAHGPLHVPPVGTYEAPITDPEDGAQLFAAMLEVADLELGRVLASIPDDVRARTTILLVGDNGTSLLAVDPAFDRGAGKGSPDEAGVRVPFLAAGRGVGAAGATCDALVHVVDLFPTIAELSGASLPDVPLDGISLVPLLAHPARPGGHDELYAENFSPNGPGPYESDERTVRTRDFKLIRRLVGDELYRLQPGSIDEGPNLLRAPLGSEEAAAYAVLAADIEEITASLVQ
jgi:arylsulfatase A-like enzyme